MGGTLVFGNTTHADSPVVTTLDAGFAAFWAAYPKRKAKKDARKAWADLRPTAALQAEILAALVWQTEEWANPLYTPLPASYLRGERWTDEPDAPAAPGEARRPAWAQGARTLPHYPTWSCQHGGAVYKGVVQVSCMSRSACSILTTLNRPVVAQTEGEQEP
jgi:hypothetical protein